MDFTFPEEGQIGQGLVEQTQPKLGYVLVYQSMGPFDAHLTIDTLVRRRPLGIVDAQTGIITNLKDGLQREFVDPGYNGYHYVKMPTLFFVAAFLAETPQPKSLDDLAKMLNLLFY